MDEHLEQIAESLDRIDDALTILALDKALHYMQGDDPRDDRHKKEAWAEMDRCTGRLSRRK